MKNLIPISEKEKQALNEAFNKKEPIKNHGLRRPRGEERLDELIERIERLEAIVARLDRKYRVALVTGHG